MSEPLRHSLQKPPFEAFAKIPRLNREVIVTEKIDGTNGIVYISDPSDGGSAMLLAGSRSKWITSGKEDNYGFAHWVEEHREELITGLGPGTHYGEWWGAGIQRRYDQKVKRFSLFNTHRWSDPEVRPKCCDVVPVLYTGIGFHHAAAIGLNILQEKGSQAAPGFMKPEGVVIFHSASGGLFKVTLENDESPKGKVEV